MGLSHENMQTGFVVIATPENSSVFFLSTTTDCSSASPIYNDRFISLSHCIPSQHPIMCVADSCTVGCVFMFHDLFALIKVTQNHNEVCMDTSYCCHLTTTHSMGFTKKSLFDRVFKPWVWDVADLVSLSRCRGCEHRDVFHNVTTPSPTL